MPFCFHLIETLPLFAYFTPHVEMEHRPFDILNAETGRPEQERQDDTDVLTGEPAKVILFNDEIHTFEEVIGQLIKALGCDQPLAESLTWEVHTKGKALVFEGVMNECLKVSSVLEEIALHTKIEV